MLVILMTIPGLALFYGGLVRSKNMLSVLMQVMVTFSMIIVLWFIYGYSLLDDRMNRSEPRARVRGVVQQRRARCRLPGPPRVGPANVSQQTGEALNHALSFRRAQCSMRSTSPCDAGGTLPVPQGPSSHAFASAYGPPRSSARW